MQNMGFMDFLNIAASIAQPVIAIALCVMAVAYLARRG